MCLAIHLWRISDILDSYFTHDDCLRTEHSTYAHDGVSSLPFDCLAPYLGQDLLTLVVKTAVQTPKAMDMRVDRKAFLASISYVGEDGKRHSLEDWEYGPGHGPDGALHVEGSLAQFGNPKRDELLAQITAHQALFRSSIPVCVIADRSSSMSSQREEYDNRSSRYNSEFPPTYQPSSSWSPSVSRAREKRSTTVGL